MWLLDKMLRKLITKGELTVVDHDGKEYHYGAPDPAQGRIKGRLTDRRAAFHIARYPRVGAGEAYMNGWLVVDPPHDVRDLILFIQANAPAETEDVLMPGPIGTAVDFLLGKFDQINWKSRSRRNAEHTYNLTRRLYELFLDEDRQ